ncbi:MAG: hypothetical protein VW709_06825, partial [Rickettsiales bacterium]
MELLIDASFVDENRDARRYGIEISLLQKHGSELVADQEFLILEFAVGGRQQIQRQDRHQHHDDRANEEPWFGERKGACPRSSHDNELAVRLKP